MYVVALFDKDVAYAYSDYLGFAVSHQSPAGQPPKLTLTLGLARMRAEETSARPVFGPTPGGLRAGQPELCAEPAPTRVNPRVRLGVRVRGWG